MPSVVRRAEIIAVLSVATDLAMGQPVEFALKSCFLGLRLGQALGFTGEELRETYYEALLRYVGCNADTYAVAAFFGDEMALRRDLAAIDRANAVERTRAILRAAQRAHAGTPLLSMISGIVKVLALARSTGVPIIAGHCEVAERIALRLGLGPAISSNLGQFYERWDGRGLPSGIRGEAIARPVRVAALAQDLILLSATHNPQIVDHILAHARDVIADLKEQPSWEAVLALEPAPQALLSESELDEACRVIADFTDIT